MLSAEIFSLSLVAAHGKSGAVRPALVSGQGA
jgi:hypothetical protein